MDNYKERLEEFINEEFMVDKPDLTLTDDLLLIQDGVIDSLGIFILISFIEEEFGIKIDAGDVVLENFETLPKIVELVQSSK